jgi:hypothetical protein
VPYRQLHPVALLGEIFLRETAAGIALLERRAENSKRFLKGTEVNDSKNGTVAEIVLPTCRLISRLAVRRAR